MESIKKTNTDRDRVIIIGESDWFGKNECIQTIINAGTLFNSFLLFIPIIRILSIIIITTTEF